MGGGMGGGHMGGFGGPMGGMGGGFGGGRLGGAPITGSGSGRDAHFAHRHARVGPLFAYPYGYDDYGYNQCLVYDAYSGRWISYCYN